MHTAREGTSGQNVPIYWFRPKKTVSCGDSGTGFKSLKNWGDFWEKTFFTVHFFLGFYDFRLGPIFMKFWLQGWNWFFRPRYFVKTKFILTNRSCVNDLPISTLIQPNVAIFEKTDFLGLRFLKKVGKYPKISVGRPYSLDWWLPVWYLAGTCLALAQLLLIACEVTNR